MPRELRDYQLEAVQAVYDGWAATDGRAQGIILPTGCGKTDIIARHVVDEARAGGRTLVLAHRAELLDQITERIGMHDPGVPVGRVQAGVKGRFRPVIVGMVDTLRSEKRRAQLPRPTKVIVDECHHAVSPSYLAVLDWAGVEQGTRAMGVTATMTRGGRPRRGERGLGDVWGEQPAFQRDTQWAVESGWLVPPRSRTVVVDHMDLSRARVRAGDYGDGELGEMVSQDTPEIVRAWLAYASDRITMAFTPTIASARALTEAFADAGVKVEMVIGTTPQEERRAVKARMQAGVTRVRVDVGVGTEGFDCPEVSCILMARPTKLPGFYQQMVGRGLRPCPAIGKADCLVLDVVGVTRVNSLATVVDMFRAAQVEDERPLEVVYCEECGFALPAPGLRISPLCACVREKIERDPDGGRVRIENARYEERDLFARSSLHWLVTRRLGRRFLAVGDRLAVVWPEPDGTFCAAHLAAKGVRAGSTVAQRFDIRELCAGVSMQAATESAEEWARGFDAGDLAARQAARQSQAKASYGLLAHAARFKVAGVSTMSRGQIQDAIDVTVASARLDYL